MHTTERTKENLEKASTNFCFGINGLSAKCDDDEKQGEKNIIEVITPREVSIEDDINGALGST